jgi:putative nucleotidyltransferase with HDIG domain
MRTGRARGFRGFVEEHCTSLIHHLAEALGLPVRIRDADGLVILASPGTSPVAAPDAPHPVSAPIPGALLPLGSLEVEGGNAAAAALIHALATDMGRRFAAERDLSTLDRQLVQSENEISLLCHFTHILTPEDDFASAARKLLQETARQLPRHTLVLYQPGASLIHCSPQGGRDQTLAPHQSAIEEALGAVYDNFAAATEASARPHSWLHSGALDAAHGSLDFVATVVRIQTAPIGTLAFFCAADDEGFDTGELRLLEVLASELSNTATTRELSGELREMLFNTVRSLVAAADATDDGSAGHSERVYRLSMKIAERLELPESDLQALTWAALLHDIGKIAAAPEIPRRISRVSDAEGDRVRTHPERGCELLAPIPQLHPVLPVIRHHHERFDGSGYPDGLRGEAIPLLARIVAVADAYDGVAAGTVGAKVREQALGEIRSGAGTAFDPQVVAALAELAEIGALESPADSTPDQPAA